MTSRHEFITDPQNGCLVGPDGCHYDNEREAMYYGVTGCCGCGSPPEVHKLIVDCLSQFEGDWFGQKDKGVNGIEKIVRERPDVAAEFIAHYLASVELVEHGGSVYGAWATDLGEQFIEVGAMNERDDGTG